MDAKAAYRELVERGRERAYLGALGSLAGWDLRTKSPSKGHPHRARAFAALSRVLHQKATDPRIGELLASVEDSALIEDPDVAANVRAWRRDYERVTRVPESLAVEIAEAASRGESAWAELRKKNDWEGFLPFLKKNIELKKAYAEAVGYEDEVYDALLEDYEEGLLTRDLVPLFETLKDPATRLVRRIMEAPKKPRTEILHRHYPKADQEAFILEVIPELGYDLEAGRLDETAHPFAVRIHPGDVRITTRYFEDFFNAAFFGSVHEAGHAMYEQGLPEEHWGTPLGESVSLGVHESQSRMWENLVGRSRGFWEHYFPRAKARFAALADVDLEEFVFAVNEVKPSLIRVEADEVTYNLHILLRFELELALFRGELAPEDLPEAWNRKMEAYLGVVPKTYAEGVMQDVHWAGGAFGYFPTYTLGNVYAAQLFEAAERELGALEPRFAEAAFAPLLGWLRAKVHHHGRHYPPAELIARATGEPVSAGPLLRYLEEKFGALYELT